METFLAEVARRLRADHPEGLQHTTVVFNNRRSGLFLQRQFARMEGQPFLLPRILGIDELIAELGEMEIVPNEFLIFELFDIHRHTSNEGRKFETFEEFISFGDMMLSDFSEIDLYCVDARQLFSNLHDLKSLGEWDIEAARLTPFQEHYLTFFKSLYHYYSELHSRLAASRKAYSGMAYRHVAENIESITQGRSSQDYCFVGFNALTTCEKIIIEHYVRDGTGRLYTDGDAHYATDPMQEAGHFLRKHQELLGNIDRFHNHFSQGHKEITIVSCPENVMQCKYAGLLLSEQAQKFADGDIEQTALVLADESLLLPALNSLPAEIRSANITMGYPFRNTATHALMLKLFSLHQQRHGNGYYHTDVRDLLSDPAVAGLMGETVLYAKVSDLLKEEHIIYARREELKTVCTTAEASFEAVEFLFPAAEPSPDDFLAIAQRLVLRLYEAETLSNNPKEKEALGCLLEIIRHFISLQQDYHFIESLSVLSKIYTHMAHRRSVAFYGEPLFGLQILGVLETRNLDFKRIILLSANEGVFPANKSANTLIPFNLKKAFGIPTYHDKDAVYAYNFYRLLQRADRVHILYSTEAEGMGKGEPSRFVLQVRDELSHRYPQIITLHEEALSAGSGTVPLHIPDCYEKDPASIKRIDELSASGFSPSVLNKYRNCPLRFYYEEVLRLKEGEALKEDLEQNELGDCIHEALEAIYSRDPDGRVKRATLRKAIDELDDIINRVLHEQFLHGRSQLGRNHFYKSIAKIQLTNFLRSEIKELERIGDGTIQLVGLEEELAEEVTFPTKSGGKPVLLKGRADRIDRVGGLLRIIDYKSGRADPVELEVLSPDAEYTMVPDKWFQVMMYAYLYQHGRPYREPLRTGVVALRRSSSQLLTATWGRQDILDHNLLDRFETMLLSLIDDIMNPDLPFAATPSYKNCATCSFRELCRWNETSEPET